MDDLGEPEPSKEAKLPRPLSEQVVVITGASSGIGRETALGLGRRGASVVLAARNEEALQEVAREIQCSGGLAQVVVTDVGKWYQVKRLARAAVDRFGRLDTWVNNAAITEYATVDQMTTAEIDRIVQVNLLGQIYGVKAALPYMKRQGQGTIINVASTLAERSVPLQSAYCATKHGIKGFTESLRLELTKEGSGISVTLILPSSTNTPFFAHARSKLGVEPKPISPVYDPCVVAEAILFAAQHPRRDVVIGTGKILAVAQRISPSLVDWIMLWRDLAFQAQMTDQPGRREDNLFLPLPGPGSSRGGFGQGSWSKSCYTRHLELHPMRKRALAGALLVAALVCWRRVRF